jgi:FdhD protein
MKGTKPLTFISIGDGQPPRAVNGDIVEERLVCISVNGTELATIMCSPNNLDLLALGFLANEGLISSMAEVRRLHISKSDSCAEVWLHDTAVELPRRFVITAGCGGGVTFDDMSQRHPPLQSDLRADPAELAEVMRQMHLGADLYQQARGIHTAALADGSEILLQVEDVGRHNCLDKLRGAALKDGLDTRDRVLLTSGRISSEMINKARRLGTPIICSRTSPTHLSVSLADSWQMTIIGYLRQSRMRIYTHPERVLEIERIVRDRMSAADSQYLSRDNEYVTGVTPYGETDE